MTKSVRVTVKLDPDKKMAFYDYCREHGILVNEFAENDDRADHRLIKEGSDVFFNDPAEKKAVFDFEQLLRELKLKEELH